MTANIKRRDGGALIVITPEAHLFSNRAKSRNSIPGLERVNAADIHPLMNSLDERNSLTSPQPKLTPFEENKQLSVSIKYRTSLPSVQPSESTSHKALPLYLNTHNHRLPSNSVSPTPSVKFEGASRLKKLPAVLIAKVLTTQGHGSHYPQLYPNFKDATLVPASKPTGVAQDFSDYSFLKTRLRIQNRMSATHLGGNKVLIDDQHGCSNILNSMTVPNIGNTYSAVFPKRSKKKSWRRSTKA